MTANKDLIITKGKTFSLVVRWETDPIIYKPVSAVTGVAPLTLTVPTHGCPDGWRAAMTGFKGMTEVNPSDPNRLVDRDYNQATVVDADTLAFNKINASLFKTYTSGGVVQYNTPVDLTGFTARMSIKARTQTSELLECSVGGVSGATKPTDAGQDGTVTWISVTAGVPGKEWIAGATYVAGDVIDLADLLRLTTDNARIVLDLVRSTISLVISAADTAAIDWRSGVYDLELVSPDAEPVVTELMSGKVTVVKEVTAP